MKKIEWHKLTDEQRQAGKECVRYWTENALSTGRMTEEERRKVVEHVHGLYAAGRCDPPKAIVVVQSPRMMAFVAGAASWWWYCREQEVRAATRTATDAATDEATYAATRAATDEATDDATREFVRGALRCAERWWRCYQGGNMWVGWLCWIQFARDVCGFSCPSHEPYRHLEELAKISGYRFVHKHFCLVSEKPIKLETYVNERGEHVPHCEDGPSHLWADGFAIYHIRGVRVPGWIVEHPERITIEAIEEEESAEVKLVMRQRYGEERYLRDIGATLIDSDSVPCERYNPDSKVIWRALMEDKDGRRDLVAGDGSTKDRTFVMRVPDDTETCVEAETALCGGLDPEKQFARS